MIHNSSLIIHYSLFVPFERGAWCGAVCAGGRSAARGVEKRVTTQLSNKGFRLLTKHAASNKNFGVGVA